MSFVLWNFVHSLRRWWVFRLVTCGSDPRYDLLNEPARRRLFATYMGIVREEERILEAEQVSGQHVAHTRCQTPVYVTAWASAELGQLPRSHEYSSNRTVQHLNRPSS